MKYHITSKEVKYEGEWSPLYGSVMSDIASQVNARIDAMEKEGFYREYRREFYINSLYIQLLSQHGVNGVLPKDPFVKSARVRNLHTLNKDYVVISDMMALAGYVDVNYKISAAELVQDIRAKHVNELWANEEILAVCGEDVYIEHVFTAERRELMKRYMALPLVDNSLFTQETYLDDVYVFEGNELVEIHKDVKKTRTLYNGVSSFRYADLDKIDNDNKGVSRCSESRLSLECIVFF